MKKPHTNKVRTVTIIGLALSANARLVYDKNVYRFATAELRLSVSCICSFTQTAKAPVALYRGMLLIFQEQ